MLFTSDIADRTWPPGSPRQASGGFALPSPARCCYLRRIMAEQATIIDGKALAQTVRGEVKTRAESFLAKHGRQPGLHVVLVGWAAGRLGAPYTVACVQFAVCSALSLLVAAFTEPMAWDAVQAAAGAIASILSELVRSGRLKVVESFDVDAPKTQQLNAKIEAIGGGKTLIVTESGSQNLFLAAQNLPYVGVVDVAGINPVDLVYADNVVMTVDTVKKVEEWLA